MSDRPIIEVENLGKRYRLGAARGGSGGSGANYQTLRESLSQGARRLLPRGRRADGAALSSTPDETEFWALRDVSFSVQPGEVVGIIGRNGAGKSTLLKILSRITDPTEGRVTLRGRVASLLEVGTGFHPELTGRENIYLNGAVLGMGRQEIRAKFDEIVAFAEVDRFLDTPVKRYSSGMYVRLAFAVAAHLEPEILIVDEVLAVGDAQFQKKCLGKMHEVAKGGRTVLFVSHNMGVMNALCNVGILLKSGQVVSSGKMADVVDAYSGQATDKRDAVFEADRLKPSITRVSVDPEELASGNLVVDVAFASPFPLRQIVPGLVLSTLGGIPVFGSNTRFHPGQFQNDMTDAGVLRMRADKVPVRAGHYRISVWLGDWQIDYDHKSEALTFELGSKLTEMSMPGPESIGYLKWPATWVGVNPKHRE